MNARKKGDDTMARDSKTDPVADLKKRLAGGNLTRRAFFERATALGLSMAAATKLMSGTAEAAEPKKGGHLRVGVGHGSTTDSLDPATFENAFMSNGVGYAKNNHIAELGTSGELEPELAESWEASDDAVQWIFKIRPGVEFHNGKTVDADDVVASVNHHRGEDSKSAAKPLLVQLKDIKADGKDTVVVELDGGNADFPFIISDYHIAILPSSEGKIDWASGVGAGGYTVESFEPGVRADFKR
jgi:peptide/nickel transport system substrate-binding protein